MTLPARIELKLPYPPSVNSIWRKSPKGMYRSKKYVNWIKDCDAHVLGLRQKDRLIRGAFTAKIMAVKPDKRKRDLDNLPKVLLDYAKRIKAIEDDSLCEFLSIQWVKGPLFLAYPSIGCVLLLEEHH